MHRKQREIERNRDRDVLGKEKRFVGGREMCIWKCVKYFGTKFESYKVKYFGTEGVRLYSLHFNL